jgi:hypothetical protein
MTLPIIPPARPEGVEELPELYKPNKDSTTSGLFQNFLDWETPCTPGIGTK